MTLQELADKEDNLYSKVIELSNQPQNGTTNTKLNEIFLEYKRIHKQYADISSHNMEALKRGLFIQWYSLLEPKYLTGISELDKNAEEKIVHVMNELIEAGEVDCELVWMLNHYSNWGWALQGLSDKFVSQKNYPWPNNMTREEMKLRGQMGIYLNSLAVY